MDLPRPLRQATTPKLMSTLPLADHRRVTSMAPPRAFQALRAKYHVIELIDVVLDPEISEQTFQVDLTQHRVIDRHRMPASPSRASSAPDIANLDSAAPKASASASTETVNPFYRAPCLPPAGHGTRGAQGNRSSNPPTDRKINRSPASTGYSASRRHTSRDGNPPGTG